jgi:hypothetical protein
MAGNVPTLEELQKYNVNRPGDIEGVKSSLYDFQSYATAGTTQMTFFQVPIGQSSKTKYDTNMEVAGSLPAPKRFLIERIEIYFYPGSAISYSGASVATRLGQADDCYNIAKSGYLDLFIGSKSYLTEAPIGRFPPTVGLKAETSVAIGSGGAGVLGYDYATFAGQPYNLMPPILLVPTQNFNVTLNWPTAVATPSGNNARIGIVLKGILYRNSQ